MWKALGVFLVGSTTLSGCSLWWKAETPGEMYGWNALKPPRENALGRQLFAGGKVGDPVIDLTPSNIEMSPALGTASNEVYSKSNAQLELIAKGASASLGYDYESAKKVESNEWKILQIKDFAYYLPVEQRFIYQCLTASKYNFELTNKSGANATLDAGPLAKIFGVDEANIGFTSNPDNPDKLTVSVDNPNVCLAYVSAYFRNVTKWMEESISEKYVDITAKNGSEKYSTTFSLTPGQRSWFRAPEYSGKESPHKPWYRIASIVDQSGKAELEICKQNRTGRRDYSCRTLDKKSDGQWDHLYHIDTFSFGDNMYKVITLDIDAKRLENNIIHVEYAKLSFPEYELILK
ncbi:hypothetical protein D3C85_891460 [compost metagenome]|jgi:hypothetical protein